MFTTGSKLFFGATALSVLGAVVFAASNGGPTGIMGTVGLLSLAVVFGFLGTTLDAGARDQRWKRWRPTVALCRQPDLPIDRLELWCTPGSERVLAQVTADLAEVAPRYAELAPTAYAQIATAVIITAIMAPILTGWVDKKFCQGKEDLSPAGVEAIEEAVATDIDGE